MDSERLKFLAFAVLFAVVLNGRHVDCLIEYSSYSDDDILLEMQIFNEVETMFNDCMKMDPKNTVYAESLEWTEDRINRENDIKEIYSALKMEFLCLQIKTRDDDSIKFDSELITLYMALWITQHLTAQYSLLFANGYLQNKDSDQVTADNCAYVAAYLGTFARDGNFSHIFLERVVEIIKRRTKDRLPRAYHTIRGVGHLYEFDLCQPISTNFDWNYDPDRKLNLECSMAENVKERVTTATTALNLYSAYTVFGKKETLSSSTNIAVDDESCWNGVRTILQGNEENYGNFVDLKEMNQDSIDLLKQAETFQKSVVVEDKVLWASAGILKALITSDSSNKSKLVSVIREIEKIKAKGGYKGDEKFLEKLTQGFTDGSVLKLVPDTDTIEKSIPYQFSRVRN